MEISLPTGEARMGGSGSFVGFLGTAPFWPCWLKWGSDVGPDDACDDNGLFAFCETLRRRQSGQRAEQGGEEFAGQPSQLIQQICGERGVDDDLLPRDGVAEGNQEGMEAVARVVCEGSAPVTAVSPHGVAGEGEVLADLVHPAGDRGDEEEGRTMALEQGAELVWASLPSSGASMVPSAAACHRNSR